MSIDQYSSCSKIPDHIDWWFPNGQSVWYSCQSDISEIKTTNNNPVKIIIVCTVHIGWRFNLIILPVPSVDMCWSNITNWYRIHLRRGRKQGCPKSTCWNLELISLKLGAVLYQKQLMMTRRDSCRMKLIPPSLPPPPSPVIPGLIKLNLPESRSPEISTFLTFPQVRIPPYLHTGWLLVFVYAYLV